MCPRIDLTRADSPEKSTQPPPQWSSWRARRGSFLSVLHVASTTRQTCTLERREDCFDLLRYKLPSLALLPPPMNYQASPEFV